MKTSEIRIVNWSHFHGLGLDRYEHQHIHDARDEKHNRGFHLDNLTNKLSSAIL